MGHYNNFINRTITLFEELTGEKPEAILIGSWDFKTYSHSLEYEKEIQGVPIEEEDIEPEGIFIHSSSKTYPYVVMVEAYIAYEMEGTKSPNVMRISRDFYNIFNYAFTTDEPSYNPTLNCIIEIVDELWEDIICGHFEEYEEQINQYKQVIDKPKIPVEFTFQKPVMIDAGISDEKPIKIITPKEKFIDWLLDDIEVQLDAIDYIEDHEEEIDKDFILFQRECEFKRYLKDNGYDNYEEEDL